MKRDLITKPSSPTWELVDADQSIRMLTPAELARLQGFTQPEYTTESPPCAHFATPQKPRLA